MKRFVLIPVGLIIIVLVFTDWHSAGLNNQATGLASPPAGETVAAVVKPETAIIPPLDNLSARLTKKFFGDYITPVASPVSPEKFSGYHTGIDLEILPDEENQTVAVKAICDGRLLLKRWVSGYGGVAVQQCELADQPVTVIYGHLYLASITSQASDALSQGQAVGNLGRGYTAETDGERQHLHLGIHRGQEIELRGYVQHEEELLVWFDPLTIF
ncbi:MAG: hypothetical protein UV78_C0055G0002 [Parcubacteria group bacterium GW2011_GWA2_43_17]|nr:MAG: hypothetical protein UV78_C0055G0002 [Parcubacteria group bacterium GW2011_GWA2_43_17]KKT90900.1 MAG: hypothetical protein UW91_C0043G0002 [Parcubacteria group bacterium GW2011_GWF2_45_11]KKT97131.1 MAG: hypothetical protein UW98_C0023G0002 [Parcubacteria group bacterium GW2011_GWC2_45_15]OGY95054.1 MAG: hypothetical protein A3J95_00640 [Candidatus Komeilibacteria bacterium RIFOXYC2_FULL_45_12]HAH04840.1 hypothetical protein [Candidatus Komeilibacteria bacterium]